MKQQYWGWVTAGLLVILLSHTLTASAELIQGGVSKSWTIDSARQEAFNNAQMHRDLSQFPAMDPYYSNSQKARVEHREHIGNIYYTFFASGHYSVDPLDRPYSFYFEPDGRLLYVEYDTVKRHYPSKAYKYKYPSGELETTSLSVDFDESFIFNPDGTLLGHWKHQNCYLADGSNCGTRWGSR